MTNYSIGKKTVKKAKQSVEAVVPFNAMKEKRKKILEEVRKRRAELYSRLRKEGKIS